MHTLRDRIILDYLYEYKPKISNNLSHDDADTRQLVIYCQSMIYVNISTNTAEQHIKVIDDKYQLVLQTNLFSWINIPNQFHLEYLAKLSSDKYGDLDQMVTDKHNNLGRNWKNSLS